MSDISLDDIKRVWQLPKLQNALAALREKYTDDDIYEAAAENDKYPLGYFAPGRFASDALKNDFNTLLKNAIDGTCEECSSTGAKYRETLDKVLCDSCYNKRSTPVTQVPLSILNGINIADGVDIIDVINGRNSNASKPDFVNGARAYGMYAKDKGDE